MHAVNDEDILWSLAVMFPDKNSVHTGRLFSKSTSGAGSRVRIYTPAG